MRSSLETFTRLLLECVGRTLDGPVILDKIKLSLSSPSIATIRIDLCAKSSDTEATTEASLPPSQSKPPSQNQSSLDSNQSTSELSLLIYDGIGGPMIRFDHLVSLLHSVGVSVGSSDDEVNPRPCERQLLMTLRDL